MSTNDLTLGAIGQTLMGMRSCPPVFTSQILGIATAVVRRGGADSSVRTAEAILKKHSDHEALTEDDRAAFCRHFPFPVLAWMMALDATLAVAPQPHPLNTQMTCITHSVMVAIDGQMLVNEDLSVQEIMGEHWLTATPTCLFIPRTIVQVVRRSRPRLTNVTTPTRGRLSRPPFLSGASPPTTTATQMHPSMRHCSAPLQSPFQTTTLRRPLVPTRWHSCTARRASESWSRRRRRWCVIEGRVGCEAA